MLCQTLLNHTWVIPQKHVGRRHLVNYSRHLKLFQVRSATEKAYQLRKMRRFTTLICYNKGEICAFASPVVSGYVKGRKSLRRKVVKREK